MAYLSGLSIEELAAYCTGVLASHGAFEVNLAIDGDLAPDPGPEVPATISLEPLVATSRYCPDCRQKRTPSTFGRFDTCRPCRAKELLSA